MPFQQDIPTVHQSISSCSKVHTRPAHQISGTGRVYKALHAMAAAREPMALLSGAARIPARPTWSLTNRLKQASLVETACQIWVCGDLRSTCGWSNLHM